MVSTAYCQHDNNAEDGGTKSNAPEQILKGPLEVMRDTELAQSFLNTTFTYSRLIYTCNEDNFMMDGSKVVVNWTVDTVGTGLKLKGTMIAKFCPESNKMLSAEITFDTGVVQRVVDNKLHTNHTQTQPSEIPSSTSINSQHSTELEVSFNRTTNESLPRVVQ